jgi:hypothetical protein
MLAPAALAQVSTSQIPGGDAVGTVTDTVTDTVSGGGSGDTSSGGGGVTAPVTNVVDSTTDTADKATGGGVGTVVDTTTETVKDTSEQTQKTVDNTTSETGTTVHNTVNDTNDLGGSVTNPLLNAQDPKAKESNENQTASGGQRTVGARSDNKKAAYQGEFAGDRTFRKAGERRGKFGSLAAAEKKNRNNTISATPAYAEAPERETFITQLAQAATEAAEKLAFPLGLALMVGAFLMVQGRIDRKDAKLVLAPIDSEQDLLSFS